MKGKRTTALCYVTAAVWAAAAAFWLLQYFGMITGSLTGDDLAAILGLVSAGLAVAWLVRAIKRTKNPPEEE